MRILWEYPHKTTKRQKELVSLNLRTQFGVNRKLCIQKRGTKDIIIFDPYETAKRHIIKCNKQNIIWRIWWVFSIAVPGKRTLWKFSD